MLTLALAERLGVERDHDPYPQLAVSAAVASLRVAVLGMALATVAMALLAIMGAGTTQLTVSVYMVLLGAGLGFTMQTLVPATQKDLALADLGVATASDPFFR